MKNVMFILLFVSSIISCIDAQEVAKLSKNKSLIRWAGSHSFGFGEHDGTVDLKSGGLTMKQGKVTGGKFVLDMNSIVNTDGDYSQDLVDHLKSEDFFNVSKYPTAELLITKVHYFDPSNTPNDPIVYFKVTADLIIKGISHPIEFNAETNNQHSEINSRFKIDRTLWGINFQSKGYAEKLKSSIISDAIEFNIFLKID